MFKLFGVFLSLSSFSCLGSLYKKKYEEVLPITVISIMIFLYLFYIVDLLNIGFIFLLLILFLVYIYFLYKLIRMNKSKRKEVYNNLFTPGFFIYLICFIVIFVFTYNNQVLLWDELRLWGAYPKILFYDGSLQLDTNSQLIDYMRSYNPGMPLFLFFITKVFGEFKEGLLFFGYGVFGLSLLCPVLKNISFKKWYLIPFYVFGLLLFPLLFANSNNDGLVYYFTLFIEPILGIIFGYSMYLTFNCIMINKFKYFLFILVVSGMVLLKDTGILFSIISCCAFILNEFLVYKKYKKKKFGLFKLFVPFLISLFIFASWKGVQSLYESGNIYTSALDISEIVSMFIRPTEEQQLLLSAAKNEVLFRPIVDSNFPALNRFYSFPVMFIVMFCIFIALIFIKGKKEYKNNFISTSCFFVGGLIYLFGTLFVYFFSIHTVASFPRYISLLFTAGSVIIGLLLCDTYTSIIKLNKKVWLNYFTCSIFLFCLIAMPIRQPQSNMSYFLEKANIISESYSEVIKNNTSIDSKIALVFTEEHRDDFSNVIYHHQIYLDLIDEGYHSFECLFVDDELISYEEYKDFDYLYFISIDYDELEVYSDILNIELERSSLFKVLGTKEFLLVN